MKTIGKRISMPGDKIRELRENHGWTQDELVEKVKMIYREKGLDLEFKQESLSRMEHNKNKHWPLAPMEAIAEALGTDSQYLLGTLDDFAHFSDEERAFLRNPDSVPYIRRALIQYLQDKMEEEGK